MRRLLILCVMCAVGAVFYWAGTRKSGEIEADIQARVLRDLALAGASGVEAKVQGRHVTLSGSVNGKETKAAYLGVARGTYGALGPVDNLKLTLDKEAVFAEEAPQTSQVESSEEFERLQVALRDAEASAEIARAQLEDRDLQLSALMQELRTQKASPAGEGTSADLEARIGALEDTIEAQQQELLALAAKRDQLDAYSQEQAEALVASAAREAAQQELLTALSAELDALRGVLATGGDQAGDAALSVLRQKNADLLQALEQQEQSLAEMEHDHAQVLEGLLDELKLREEELTELRAQSETQPEPSIEPNDASQKLNELEAELKESLLQNAVLSVALEELRSDIELERSQMSLLEDEKAQLVAQLSGTDETLQLARYEEELTDLQGQLAEKNTQIVNLSDRIAMLDQQNSAFLQNVTEPKVAISFLQTLTDDTVAIPGLIEHCTAQAKGIMQGGTIGFEIGTSEIDGQSAALLERMAETIKLCARNGLIVEIGGHSSALGNKDWNQTLSENRAQSVVDFMVERGVAADFMVARGFGDAVPIASNDTYEGRAKNRRITFEWQSRSAQN